MKIIRTIYHLAAFTLFIIQAQESLYKFFQDPVILQKSWTNVDSLQKPFVQICFLSYYDYEKAAKIGYPKYRTKFLAGMVQNSTLPTWKGIHQNHTFQELQNILFEKDYSHVEVSISKNPRYFLNKGFCLEANGTGEYMEIVATNTNLVVYLEHNSTDLRLFSELNPNSYIKFGATSNTTFDMMEYEIFYEVHDNTIYEGSACVDYRKQNESYGDCNYKAFKEYVASIYGCQPPWMEEPEKETCEIGIPSKNIDSALYHSLWEDINALTGRRKMDILKKCLPSCYQVKTRLKKNYFDPGRKKNAKLEFYESDERQGYNIKVNT